MKKFLRIIILSFVFIMCFGISVFADSTTGKSGAIASSLTNSQLGSTFGSNLNILYTNYPNADFVYLDFSKVNGSAYLPSAINGKKGLFAFNPSVSWNFGFSIYLDANLGYVNASKFYSTGAYAWITDDGVYNNGDLWFAHLSTSVWGIQQYELVPNSVMVKPVVNRNITINYVDVNGVSLGSNTVSVTDGTYYNVSPNITGYSIVPGQTTSILADSNKTINITMDRNIYTLTVQCLDENSNVLKTFTQTGKYGDTLTVVPSSIEGYDLIDTTAQDVVLTQDSVAVIHYKTSTETGLLWNIKDFFGGFFDKVFGLIVPSDFLKFLTDNFTEIKDLVMQKFGIDGYLQVIRDFTDNGANSSSPYYLHQSMSTDVGGNHYWNPAPTPNTFADVTLSGVHIQQNFVDFSWYDSIRPQAMMFVKGVLFFLMLFGCISNIIGLLRGGNFIKDSVLMGSSLGSTAQTVASVSKIEEILK